MNYIWTVYDWTVYYWTIYKPFSYKVDIDTAGNNINYKSNVI